MKVRKVFITLELETNVPIKKLKDKNLWEFGSYDDFLDIIQVQANVIKKEK